MGARIDVVDDEANIRTLIRMTLEAEGYDVREFASGEAFWEVVEQTPPELCLLDRMLPGIDGLELVRRLRAGARTAALPIIMITARGTELDRVVGLELGADDYITKPFGLSELVARVRALLRREQRSMHGESAGGETLSVGGVELDLYTHRCQREGEEVDLTAREFDLLRALMQAKGRVLSREQLLDLAWGENYWGEPRAIDVYIRYLRQKLEKQPEDPELIVTVRGVGYRMG